MNRLLNRLLNLALAAGAGAVLLGLLLPIRHGVIYGSRPGTMHINCMSNMKQIGIAYRLWSGDHGDNYVVNTSTNQGGTLEFCDRDRDGFERHSALHFLPMSNELSTPKVLTCPQDKSKKWAEDWAHLTDANVTYRVRSGKDVDETNPRGVLFVCPIDGNTAYCDGSVEPGKFGKPK